MNTPNIKQLAQASSASYGIISKGNRQTRLDKTQQKAPQNYTVVPNYTDKDMSTFKHNDDGHFIIAHRGSSFSLDDTSKKDIIADANIAFGNTTDDALHKRRTKRPNRLSKRLRKKVALILTYTSQVTRWEAIPQTTLWFIRPLYVTTSKV